MCWACVFNHFCIVGKLTVYTYGKDFGETAGMQSFLLVLAACQCTKYHAMYTVNTKITYFYVNTRLTEGNVNGHKI